MAPRSKSTPILVVAVIAVTAALPSSAQTVQPPFAADYTLSNLGPVPGLPLPYGGLTFLQGDPDTLLIGGDANYSDGEIYAISVVRGAGNHVVGFSGTARFYCDGAYNDGGLDWGPGNVLFYSRYPTNELGQVVWGSAVTDRVVDLAAVGVSQTPGALLFVPPGHPGAGSLKLCSWPGGDWYDLAYSPDGTGTFNIDASDYQTTISGGPEGFIYIPTGSPGFPSPSMLVSEFSANTVGAYEVDSNGDPLPGTRRDFITGLNGAEGAVIDPLTGDFLFSTWGTGTDVVMVVEGFAPLQPSAEPIPTLNEPGIALFVLLMLATGILVLWRRLR